MQHESLTPSWWPAEFFPKMQWRPVSSRREPQIGLGWHRDVSDDALIHRSTSLRIRDTNYAPPNCPRGEVHALSVVPKALPFER
jgi:hypothetical protein